MKFKHIIWDWNGTLLDDLDVSIDALNRLLKKEDLPLVANKEEYRQYFQFPVIEYYKKVGFDFQKTPFPLLAKEYMAYYQPTSLKCKLHQNAEQTLEKFKEEGYQQYLISASDLRFLQKQLAKYPIKKYFSAVKGLDNIHAHSKAELARHFIKERGLPTEKVVFVGDSVHDSEVAAYANCSCILIANGHEHKDKLLQTGAPVFDDIKQFSTYLDSL